MAHRVLSLPARYGIGGDVVDGYVARPATPGPHPGLVVISAMGELNWFQHSLPRMAVAVGASAADAEE